MLCQPKAKDTQIYVFNDFRNTASGCVWVPLDIWTPLVLPQIEWLAIVALALTGKSSPSDGNSLFVSFLQCFIFLFFPKTLIFESKPCDTYRTGIYTKI